MNVRKNCDCVLSRFFFFFLLFFGCITSASAAGPVEASSLPGGATVSDSDGGSGESWGRAGGRTWGFSDFQLDNFTALDWEGLSAGLAFDNEITGGTAEEMVGPSREDAYTLTWAGEAYIFNGETQGLEAVFTRLTVSANESFSPTSPYQIDVISASGVFEVNLLFEASLDGETWFPALEFFDAFPTPSEHDGYAITSFNHGFFYEQLVGMSIEEHDSNIQTRLTAIDGVLGFLKIDVPNRLQQLATDMGNGFFDISEGVGALASIVTETYNGVSEVYGKLLELESKLDALPGQSSGDWATPQDIENLRFNLNAQLESIRSNLQDNFSILLCLWIGDEIFPVCPEGAPDGLPNLLEITRLLETRVAENMREIDITAVQSPRASSETVRAFMVLTDVLGVPVDARVTRVRGILESEEEGIALTEMTFETVAVGLGFQSLSLNVSGNMNSIKSFLFEAEYLDGETTLHGVQMLSGWSN